MFTGIISEKGSITSVQPAGDSVIVTVNAPGAAVGARHGESIAVSGVCLTVTSHTEDSFTADVMGQTLTVTNPNQWQPGRSVNIESAMSVGDKLGGHIVQGHVDDIARVLSVTDNAPWRVLRFSLSDSTAPLVVDKGSIAIDGVSLTVSAAGRDWCEVSLIPETLTATTLGGLAVGDTVNIETDILARHVARLNSFTTGASA
jgi:riboflavin synthase